MGKMQADFFVLFFFFFFEELLLMTLQNQFILLGKKKKKTKWQLIMFYFFILKSHVVQINQSAHNFTWMHISPGTLLEQKFSMTVDIIHKGTISAKTETQL